MNQGMQHVVVTRDDRVLGVVRLNPGMRHGLGKNSSRYTARYMAKLTIVRDTSMVFDVIRRIWAKDAMLAVVVSGRGARGARSHRGKEQVADFSCRERVRNYPE